MRQRELCIGAQAVLEPGAPSPPTNRDVKERHRCLPKVLLRAGIHYGKLPAMGSVTFGLWVGVFAALSPTSAWEDATESTIGPTGEWSNKVELADVDGDGLVDILFANGGNYASPGSPERNRVFRNQGPGQPFEEITTWVFGDTPDLARVVKAGDLNGDGVLDLVVGTTYETQSRLFLGQGWGAFEEKTTSHLPAKLASVGDLELGDVDNDGDLDIVLATWGAGNPLKNDGGHTLLWLNDGTGRFQDVTEERMPARLVRFSWDLELVDCENDGDLDILVSCKSCAASVALRNDGGGQFVEDEEALPAFSNNYDFEAMDLNGDGWLDLVTINDGPGLTEHVFIADGTGGYDDQTALLWPSAANPSADDNAVAFLDYDSDGDADFLIGSLNGTDRLLLNDGQGNLTLDETVFSGTSTPGTLGLAVGDLNGDGRLDVVHAQGETASSDKVFLGVDIAPDTAAPVIGPLTATPIDDRIQLRVRIHDHQSPSRAHDWQQVRVDVALDGGEPDAIDLRWVGEYYWWASFQTVPYSVATLRVVAIDAAGNESESSALEVSSSAPPAAERPVDVGAEEPPEELPVEPTPDEGGTEGVDVPLPSTPDDARSAEATQRTVLTHGSEGGCQVSRRSAGEGARLWWLLLLFGFVGRRGYLLLGSAR